MSDFAGMTGCGCYDCREDEIARQRAERTQVRPRVSYRQEMSRAITRNGGPTNARELAYYLSLCDI